MARKIALAALLTLAGGAVFVASAQAALLECDFATDPGWTSVNTTGTNLDFGYSPDTNKAGSSSGEGPKGEIGGDMSRQQSDAHWYGKDVSAASLSLGTAFEMNWTTSYAADFYYDALESYDQDTQALGFYKSSTLGNDFGENTTVFAGVRQDDNNIYLILVAGGNRLETLLSTLQNQTRHEIRMKYDPTAGDYGRLSCTFDGTTTNLDLTETLRDSGATFDTFGLWAIKHSGWTAGSGPCEVYYDNLAFTVPEPSSLALGLTALLGSMLFAYRRR